ncbi:ketoacyl-synt-domain-containing protein [Pholiota conissans]|uniref:Ketoacyl-synt-domain-containing protein n=1 Tax=Pholiota conissans TaxID=109636 RepID=A0A9P6CQG5_9AGAR|nr:ketoacyl-synt-domain-containing protein [Pholiota conissans]
MYDMETLLHTFLSVSRNARTIEDPVLECGVERWTYGDLDTISSALAIDLHTQYGDRPIVAIIHENHPFILAILLATWKLGGIFAPLDPHAPPEMVRQMLDNLRPTCVIFAADNDCLKNLTNLAGIPAFLFDPKNSTATHLMQRYLHHTADLPQFLDLFPTYSSLALYLHTSSASSIANLKCVPISHGVLAQGSRSRIDWIRRAWSNTLFDRLRVMGWTPWSHIMGISHDIGAATFGTGGCYIFGVLPSGYPAEPVSAPKDGTLVKTLLDGALRLQPDVLIGVPWLLEGIKDIYVTLLSGSDEESLQKAKSIRTTFVGLKYLGIGGATTSTETLHWATDLGIKIVQDFGMTELGRPLFHSKVTADNIDTEGWAKEDCLIEDAELKLINDTGNTRLLGELVITSSMINSHGYLKYDNSAFSQTLDGKVTFKTGDVYCKDSEGRLAWRGRKEDCIQMTTSETLDPRPTEKKFKTCPAIADCCIVGNNFLRKPSDFICAIIRPSSTSPSSSDLAKITEALAAVNRTLLPPLRIAWSRVLFLGEDQNIPYTRKGAVFRKKLEDAFGPLLSSRLAYLSSSISTDLDIANRAVLESSGKWRKEDVETLVMDALADVLGVTLDTLIANRNLSFAEFGMDSEMAVRIVDKLNNLFNAMLPPNACHTFVNLAELVQAILIELGIEDERVSRHLPTPPRPTQSAGITVVIVGQAFRLPGSIDTPESFWEALVNKRDDIITDIPPERWDHKSFYRPPSSTVPPQSCDITFEKAGFIDVAHYDNSFFEISAPEALSVAPNVRLTLETAFEALENAGIPISKVRGTTMGVFVGAGMDVGYHEMMSLEKGFDVFNRFYGSGMAASTACGRLSYLLDIHGPSITIDTACSSGLVAFDQGVKFLQSGRGESAIVSAVNTNIWPGSFGFLSAQKMASPNSRCATFTSQADGYVPSEGCVSLVLKTEAAALRDGDTILAVVKASEVMHGGRSQGLVAPNVHTQIELQRQLLYQSSLKPSEIDFLEAHGTGTTLGDLIEIQGINEVFKGERREHPLIIGAAKSCIGHTELAAGLVGVLKTIASFKHAAVPGLMHLTATNLNPSLDINTVPLKLPQTTEILPPKDAPHRGLVLANGFAGTISGTILEGPKKNDTQTTDANRHAISPMLFVVSAKTIDALKDYIRKYVEHCKSAPTSMFSAICYTSCVGREHYRYRFSCVTSSLRDLTSAMEQYLQISRRHDDRPIQRIAFAFPGQGSQYPGMAADLAGRFPEFRDILTSAAETASQISGYRIISFLLEEHTSDLRDSGQCGQICIFVYQYSITIWLKQLGILPYALLGHSLGEIAAAVIAGAMTYEQGLELVIFRASVLKSVPGRAGAMAIISASEETVANLIRQLHLDHDLVIAVFNGPQSHVISGDSNAVSSFVANAKAHGLRVAKLKVSQAFHSPMICSGLPPLQTWVDEHIPHSRIVLPLYSTVYGKEIPRGASLASDYWIAHARDPVKFSEAIQALISSRSVDVVLDIGPQPFIWTSLQEHTHDMLSIATSTKPSADQSFAFLTAISLLFQNGTTLDFAKLFSGCGFHKTSIPTYPFQRHHYFPNRIPSRNMGTSLHLSTVPTTSVEHALQFPIDVPLLSLLDDHLIEGRKVLPGAALVDFFAVRSQYKSLKSIIFHSPMVIEHHIETSGNYDQGSGSFSLSSSMGDSHTSKICSGIAALQSSAVVPMNLDNDPIVCGTSRSKDDVYSSFKNVEFGPSFRNIQQLTTYPTHTDAFVIVNPTQYSEGDRIRKLDCCLHTFGAVMQGKVPQNHQEHGSFLPASLEGFTLHTDDLPDSFICRYYLPLEMTRNFHVISAAFEVLSLSGELLISCPKYSVAWLAFGTAIQNAEATTNDSSPQWWFEQAWIERPLPVQENDRTSTPVAKYDRLLYVGYHHSRLPRPASSEAKKAFFIDFPSHSDNASQSRMDLPSAKSLFHFLSEEPGVPLSIILDLTAIQSTPYDSTPMKLHHFVLEFMQLLLRRKITISKFLLVSEMSVSVENDAGAGDFAVAPSLASLVQGMLRVFRRETALDTQVWGLDLPPLEVVGEEGIEEIILDELDSRQKGSTVDRVIAYRLRDDHSLQRVVPILLPIVDQDKTVKKLSSFGGVTLIVGLGSIGSALAPSLVSNGGGIVVFIGRRPQNAEIESAMEKLQTQTNGCCSYVQVDVNDIASLRSVMSDIQSRYGPIEHIIHTAAVVRDATIQNMDAESFDAVLAPKVLGSWNLHVVSEEICTSLKSFVLLSSISVPLGNPGQVAYVAGNHYMEVLASHRRAKKLPGTCIQLGAWESRLTDVMDDAVRDSQYHMDNETGIPLILKAIAMPQTVQVVAKLPMNILINNPAFSLDPLFKEILLRGRSGANHQSSSLDASEELLDIVRTVLELQPTDKLEMTDSLNACGVDSIAFAQIRGKVLPRLGVDVPMKFLSDSFTIGEMLNHVSETYNDLRGSL